MRSGLEVSEKRAVYPQQMTPDLPLFTRLPYGHSPDPQPRAGRPSLPVRPDPRISFHPEPRQHCHPALGGYSTFRDGVWYARLQYDMPFLGLVQEHIEDRHLCGLYNLCYELQQEVRWARRWAVLSLLSRATAEDWVAPMSRAISSRGHGRVCSQIYLSALTAQGLRRSPPPPARLCQWRLLPRRGALPLPTPGGNGHLSDG